MLFYTKTVKESLEELGSNQDGLSKVEAADRLVQYGLNIIQVKGVPFWHVIIEPFANIFMFVLFLAAAISLWHQEMVDVCIIAAIMLTNATIFYVQHFSTNRILRSLQRHDPQTADVIREGSVLRLDVSELVPGDIILLDEGEKIPADARLVRVESLRVDESQLTGESLPIEKQIDDLHAEKELYEQSNMVFQGSFVIGGKATALVVATGNGTEFGKLAALSVSPPEQSPVQQKIDKLISKIIRIIAVVGIVTFVLTIYRGMEFSEGIRYVLALSVSAVPESLPVAITVILVLGMRRMARHNALVKAMRAIETIGGLTIIATDKTGTLTKNRLSIHQIWSPEGVDDQLVQGLFRSANHSDSKTHDPLDVALRDYVASSKLRHTSFKTIRNIPFDQNFSMSGNLIEVSKNVSLWVKGAPESIISRCGLSKETHDKLNKVLHSYAGSGFRVIALAHMNNVSQINSFAELSSGVRFCFDGLIAVADVLRPEAKKAITEAQNAGIKVCMITGDHFETAYHIGKELGIVKNDSQVFDSREMNKMSDDQLEEVIDNIAVFSRVVPESKHRILTILKRRHITAMTGDGVNDVPALASAHVGVAMGSGASIAKDAGDIILLDNNFKSIVEAIHQGRTVIANIKRMVAYLLSTNAGEVLIALGSLICGLPIPLLPVQILWVNLVTDTCLVIPLGLEPGEKRNMRKPPQSPNSPLFSRFMISRVILVSITMAAVILPIYAYVLSRNGYDYARTIAFQVIVVMQWSSAFCYRSDYESLFIRIKRFSLSFYVGLISAVVLQFAAMTEAFGSLLHIMPVNFEDIVKYSLIAFIVPVIVVEIHKWIGRKYFHKGHKKT